MIVGIYFFLGPLLLGTRIIVFGITLRPVGFALPAPWLRSRGLELRGSVFAPGLGVPLYPAPDALPSGFPPGLNDELLGAEPPTLGRGPDLRHSGFAPGLEDELLIPAPPPLGRELEPRHSGFTPGLEDELLDPAPLCLGPGPWVLAPRPMPLAP